MGIYIMRGYVCIEYQLKIHSLSGIAPDLLSSKFNFTD